MAQYGHLLLGFSKYFSKDPDGVPLSRHRQVDLLVGKLFSGRRAVKS